MSLQETFDTNDYLLSLLLNALYIIQYWHKKVSHNLEKKAN